MTAPKRRAGSKRPKKRCAACKRLRDACVNAGYDPDALLERLAKDKKDGTAFWR